MKTRILLVVFLMLFINVVSVNAQVIKNGSCPSGWNSSGKYCVPGNNAKAIVPKNGSCPSGWNSSGKYCVAGS